MQLRAEVEHRLLYGCMIGHHLLGKFANILVVRFRQRQIAIANVNLVCRDDDTHDLRVREEPAPVPTRPERQPPRSAELLNVHSSRISGWKLE